MDRINQNIFLADGRRLGFAEYGDFSGSPVLFFHGSASSRLDRPADEKLLRNLSIRFISIDRPGHGLSDFQPKRRLLDWPDDICQLADSLGVGEFYLLGWSAGGPHALACAYAMPKRVKAVSLVGSPAPPDRPKTLAGLPLPNLILAVSARWVPGMVHFIRWLTRRLVMRDLEDASRRLMAAIPEIDKASLFAPEEFSIFKQTIQEGYRPGSKGVAHDDIIINKDWGFPLQAITVPVHIWHGEVDVNVPLNAGRYLAAVLPGARTFFLSGEGHFFLLRRWGEVLNALVNVGH